MEKSKKPLVFALALVLVVALSVAGVIAWLTSKTEEVTNTFTAGDINIDLAETTGDEYKMIPGSTLGKDPLVTVLPKSEACYLFVQVKASQNASDYLAWNVLEGGNNWTLHETATAPDNGEVKTYYRMVDAETAAAGDEYVVLENNQVKVKDTVTKEMMDALETSSNYPTLEFKAFAVQQANIQDVNKAWNKVPGGEKLENIQ